MEEERYDDIVLNSEEVDVEYGLVWEDKYGTCFQEVRKVIDLDGTLYLFNYYEEINNSSHIIFREEPIEVIPTQITITKYIPKEKYNG